MMWCWAGGCRSPSVESTGFSGLCSLRVIVISLRKAANSCTRGIGIRRLVPDVEKWKRWNASEDCVWAGWIRVSCRQLVIVQSPRSRSLRLSRGRFCEREFMGYCYNRLRSPALSIHCIVVHRQSAVSAPEGNEWTCGGKNRHLGVTGRDTKGLLACYLA